jgi:hypothetical protein
MSTSDPPDSDFGSSNNGLWARQIQILIRHSSYRRIPAHQLNYCPNRFEFQIAIIATAS